MRLKAHAGSQVHAHLGGMSLRVCIQPDGLLGAGNTEAADTVSVEVPASALAAIGNGLDGVMAHVQLSGNAELAETLSFVARHLRWDREADLARVFGPIIGRRLHLAARRVEAGVPEAGARLARNASEYLVYEGELLVDKTRFEDHLSAVRCLRDDLARLEQRVGRLAKQTA